ADPPYPGKARLYRDHPHYRGEVDHAVLIGHLAAYDGEALSTSAAALPQVLRPHPTPMSCRWNLPRDRPRLAGDGRVPWPGSLPGPWCLARVLPEAQCQGWPEAISGGNAKRP